MNVTITIKPEFQTFLSKLTEEQIKGLEADILKNGCLQPLITWDGILIDGHNRYSICQKYSLPYEIKEMQFSSEMEAKLWIFTHQSNRRNLTSYERAKIALQFEPYLREKAKKQQGARTDICQTSGKSLKPIDTKKELAKIAEASHDTIAKVKVIEEKAPNEIKQKLQKQELTINKAYQELRKIEKLEAVKSKVYEFQQKNIPACFTDIYSTDKRYNIIYADPPWKYWESGQRSANLHYQTMSIDEICRLPVKNIADNNCILFLWVVYPLLSETFNVIESWGFKYSTCGFCWIKKNPCGTNFFGLGNWTRSNSELCLIATRGCVTRIDNTIPQVIESVREAHSKKPAQVHDLIVRLAGDLPKIELFARQTAAGWDYWGNECC